jgi:hypothetical protein
MNRLTAQMLHDLFRTMLELHGVESDPWEDIDENERAAWNGLADALQEM